MKRISPVEADDRHFTLLQIKYYNNMDIPTISDIPDGMSCISYNYALAFDIEENWYRHDDKMLGNKEFLIQDPDGYLLRFTQDLREKTEQN